MIVETAWISQTLSLWRSKYSIYILDSFHRCKIYCVKKCQVSSGKILGWVLRDFGNWCMVKNIDNSPVPPNNGWRMSQLLKLFHWRKLPQKIVSNSRRWWTPCATPRCSLLHWVIWEPHYPRIVKEWEEHHF